MYLCLCIFTCIFVFVLHTLRNLEVLVPLPSKKYSTCHVYLQLWPMLYLRICVFVYLYLCICKSDTREHCFWGPCIITFQKMYGLYGLKHHTVEIRGGVTRRDDERQWKIGLLSLWAVGRLSFAISVHHFNNILSYYKIMSVGRHHFTNVFNCCAKCYWTNP